MGARLTIGEFSEITMLSVKTLRRYHEAGLLEPAEVDSRSGYRYYSPTQVPTAQVIRRFRDLGMPVRDVAEIVNSADLDLRNAVIAQHLDRLQGQLAHTQAAVTSLRRLLQPGAPPIVIDYRTQPSTVVAAIRASVDLEELLDWYSDAMDELSHTLRRHDLMPAGPAAGLYDHELFTDEHGDATVFVPVANPPAEGRVRPVVLPSGDFAVTVHQGSHDDIDITYGKLGSYVTQHALAVAGPLRETYLCGPRDTADARAWRTEIGWPVFRTAVSQLRHEVDGALTLPQREHPG
jgi:DNA-binding transcriptional MerR regulator